MIEWRNWKTGAKIGLIYGIVGMGYFLLLLWINNQPTPTVQPILDSSSNSGIVLFLAGVIIFFPLFFFSFITSIIFSSILPPNSRIIFSVVIMPLYGVLLGAIIGHFFRQQKNKNECAFSNIDPALFRVHRSDVIPCERHCDWIVLIKIV